MGAVLDLNLKKFIRPVSGCSKCYYLDGQPICSNDCKRVYDMGTISMFGKCPTCKKSWDAGLIYDNFAKQRADGNAFWKDKTDAEIQQIVEDSYSEPYRFSNLIAVSQYDKVAYHQCPFCNEVIPGTVTRDFPANEEAAE